MDSASDPISQLLQAMSDFLGMLFSFFGGFVRQILAVFLI